MVKCTSIVTVQRANPRKEPDKNTDKPITPIAHFKSTQPLHQLAQDISKRDNTTRCQILIAYIHPVQPVMYQLIQNLRQ